jgi:hypothetical protein
VVKFLDGLLSLAGSVFLVAVLAGALSAYASMNIVVSLAVSIAVFSLMGIYLRLVEIANLLKKMVAAREKLIATDDDANKKA